jgi:hypothetical protein
MGVLRRLATQVCWLAIMLSAAGCEGGADSLAQVQGKVTYKGIPLHTGSIVFTPDAVRGTSGPLGRADIQRDGTYHLRTGDAFGVVVGWHRVTIVAVEENNVPEYGRSFAIPRSLLPDKYRDPDLSGLTCEVKAGRENVIDFNLD